MKGSQAICVDSSNKYIDSIDGLTGLRSTAAFFIKKVVGNNATRSVNVLFVEEGFESVTPFLVLAVYQDEPTQQVLLLLVNIQVQQVWMTRLVIILGNLVFAQSVFLLLSCIIITHLNLYRHSKIQL